MNAVPPPRGTAGRRAVTPVDARKVEPGTGWGRETAALDFSYSVLPAAEPARRSDGERRGSNRLRTRLRSGKIIGTDGRFITECLINNRSPSGCRLRLSAAITPPPRVFLYDDQSNELFQAVVVWSQGRDIGLRLSPCPQTPANRELAGRMRRKFYAMAR